MHIYRTENKPLKLKQIKNRFLSTISNTIIKITSIYVQIIKNYPIKRLTSMMGKLENNITLANVLNVLINLNALGKIVLKL